MKKTAFVALLVASFFACKNDSKPTESATNTAVPTAENASRGLDSNITPTAKLPDSLVVEISERGVVTLGNRAVDVDDLTKKLVDSMKTLRKTHGKQPDTIIYRSKGAMMGIRGAVKDAIQDAKTEMKKQ